MITIINRTRIKKWQYIPKKERGYCLGFYWKLLSDNLLSYSIYELAREGKDIIIALPANSNKSIRDLIKDHICDNFDKVLLEWILLGRKNK